MKNIIKELWHGNIIPQEDSRNNSPDPIGYYRLGRYYPMRRKQSTPSIQGKAFLSPTKQSRDKKKKEQKFLLTNTKYLKTKAKKVSSVQTKAHFRYEHSIWSKWRHPTRTTLEKVR